MTSSAVWVPITSGKIKSDKVQLKVLMFIQEKE